MTLSQRNSMQTNIIRQGDILFTRVDKAPEVTKTQKELVVALGEATGHHHRLIAQVDSTILGDRTLFSVKGKAKLVHEEHGTIDFPEGTWMVTTEREWDYVESDMNKVVD